MTAIETLVNHQEPIARTENNVIRLPEPAQPEISDSYLTVDDFVQKFEDDEILRPELETARHWVADTFYGDDGDTIRTIRLRKGWSQTTLANELGTSQSHVARIEKGTENIHIQTCRRLCSALSIDMNTVDEYLRRQEAIACKQSASV